MNKHVPLGYSLRRIIERDPITRSDLEERLLEQLKASGGKRIDSLWNLASFHSRCDQLERAALCLRRIMELSDDLERHSCCTLALGQLAEQRGDFPAAVQYYRSALSMEPCSTDTWYFIHNNLGYSLNQVGEHEAAVTYLQSAITIDPSRANAYKNLALSYQALGDTAQAAELFISATQVNASDARSLVHLEELISSNPSLAFYVPDLQGRLEACRRAVEVATSRK